jgi:hypothetical protein
VCWRDLLKTTQNESLNSGIVCRYAFRFHHFQTWHLFLRLPANRAIGEGCKRSPIRNRLVGVNKTIWRHSAISCYEYDRLMFAYDLRIIRYQPTSASAAAWRGFMRSVYRNAEARKTAS